jgi:succinyl-diaminopimelate desuccinylase
MSAPTRSIITLTRRLIRQPSRAGIDRCEGVAGAVEAWLTRRGLAVERLREGGRMVGLCATVRGGAPGPAFMLYAALDTAGFGDEERWRLPPTAATVEAGWLYGRGAADSKAGAAIFCHLAAEMARHAGRMRGALIVLFDLDEHTGRFGGIRRYFDRASRPRPRGALIGYPGNERIVIGCRGFLRAIVTVRGEGAHSGAVRHRGVNAVSRAARLVEVLAAIELPAAGGDGFPLPPAVTVTAIRGGEGFAQVPDVCAVSVDVRLTPDFGARAARALLQRAVAGLDGGVPSALKSAIAWQPGWPAYALRRDLPLVTALQAAARAHLGRMPPTAVAGPSNPGNYLATLRIPAICGFGVSSRGVHAPDERIELATIAPVYLAYRDTLRSLLRAP